MSPELVQASPDPTAPGAASTEPGLHELTDTELDRLPCGVICLDASDRVLRYNLVEARLARLDRAQVFGRDFFAEVAPCTATPAFQGQVHSFRADRAEATVSFEYVFDFRFGAQLVTVDLFRGGRPDEVYICVNRARFTAVRTGLGSAELAAAQSDLAPGEALRGVVRDTRERRQLTVTPVLFEALAAVVTSRGGDDEWERSTAEWGRRWGQLVVMDIDNELREARGLSLADLPIADFIDRLAERSLAQGWGSLTADFRHADAGVVVLEMERNALAEALPRGAVNRCGLLAGYFESILGYVAGRDLAVREIACIAAGDDRCRFAIVGGGRMEALEAAICAERGDVDRVVAMLGELP